jgi:hypothetical protein
MALAMIHPEPGKGGRGKKSVAKNSLENGGFAVTTEGGRGKKGAKSLGGVSEELLRKARAVLDYSETVATERAAGGNVQQNLKV